MDTLILLPNQLFETKYFPKNINNILLWEHPQYFTKYKFNKLKLILHRASMKYYEAYLKHHNYNVIYKEYNQNVRANAYMFASADKLNFNANIIENPNFLVSRDLQKQYSKKTNKFVFNNFYLYCKKELNIIPNVKSLDKYNRKRLPQDKFDDIPRPYKIKYNEFHKKILRNAINYVKSNFSNNPGPTDWNTIEQSWNYPITHNQAKHLWKYFLKNKLNQGFADYQDFMYFNKDISTQQLYHSGISSSLNIGLINPAYLVKDLTRQTKIRPKEAYIRQLFWREYQLYCYNYCKDLNPKNNYFGGNGKLNKYWYNGTSNIYPIDYCVKKAFQTGYLHHIERLMIIGNFMLLSGIKPTEGFRWFMEFSIDSYEWVMFQNVYDMVFYITGGKTMKRPYISSSNYILKMSNLILKDSKEWADIWNKMYHNFIKKHKNKLGYPYMRK